MKYILNEVLLQCNILLCHRLTAKSRDYNKRPVDRKKCKVFVTAHIILRTAAMFLASALNRGSHPPPGNTENGVTNTGGKYLLFRALANNMTPLKNH